MQIQNEDASLPALEFCSMKDKNSKNVQWTLQRKGEGKYIYVNQNEGVDALEDGWAERFEAIWAMQCAIDFEQPVCKDNPTAVYGSFDSPDCPKDGDTPSRQSSASLSTMPATTVGYR